MCYNYSVKAKPEELEKRYNASFETVETFKPVFHTTGFKYEKLPVILNEDRDHIRLLNWGLIPWWNKDKAKALKSRGNTLNARSETLFEKSSFKSSITSKRCLVPATGFFEWMDVDKKKYPFHIYLKNEPIFSFGGIWDRCKLKNENGETEIIETFSIITTDANVLMAKIHNLKQRMPLILPREAEKDWLNDDISKEQVESMLLPYLDDKMEAYTISKLITSKKESSNTEKVLEPFEYEELKDIV